MGEESLHLALPHMSPACCQGGEFLAEGRSGGLRVGTAAHRDAGSGPSGVCWKKGGRNSGSLARPSAVGSHVANAC